MSREPGLLRKALGRAAGRARLFLATAEALIREPRSFFFRYFAFAGTRFADALAERSAASFPYMKPFPFLGSAIGISAALAPLTQLVVLDIAGKDARMFEPGFIEMLEGLRGQRPGGVDFGALTGIPVVDPALAGAARYGAYFLFGMLFWSMAQKQLTIKAGAHCFAYLVAVTTVAQAALQLIVGALHVAVGMNVQALMALDFMAETAMAAYILVMPSLVLPAVLRVDRSMVVNATLRALGIWFATQLFFQLVQLAVGIPIRNFGLGLFGFL